MRLYDPLEMELPDLGLVVDAGRRDRRAALRRHARPRLSQALRRSGRAARGGAARGVRDAPASTRWSCPPTTISSTRCCASPTCASGAASWRDAAAASAATHRCARSTRMTFLWPDDAVAAAARAGAGRCVLSGCCAGSKKAARALREPCAWSRRRWARASASAATCRRCCSCSRCTLMIVAIARPAARRHAAVAARDGHPGDGRVGQHARDRRRSRTASSPRRPRPRRSSPTSRSTRASASCRSPAPPRSCRRRPEPRGHHRGDRPLPAAARHRDRQRHPRVAGDDLPGRRHSICGRRIRGATRRARRRARSAAQAPTSGVQAGAARARTRRRRSSCSPTARRTTGPDPIEAAKHGRRPRRARLHRRHRHRRTARSSASRAGRCACGSTRRR